jgi:hypothetical protein
MHGNKYCSVQKSVRSMPESAGNTNMLFANTWARKTYR